MEKIEVISLLNDSGLSVESVHDAVKVSKKYRTDIHLPYRISLTEDLIRAIYLFWGDGSYIEKIHFTNKEPELHQFIIKAFEKYLGISKSVWRLRILYNKREGEDVENIKLKWLDSLDFEKRQLYPTVAITGFKSNPNGNGRIIIDKLSYGDFVRSLITYVNSLIENHLLAERQLTAVLDGILNAEGSALVDDIGLHKIVITVHEKEIQFVRKVLSQLNLNDIFIERQGKLTVMGWRRLYKAIRLFAKNNTCPFSLHTERRKNLINGFLEHKRSVALYRYLSIIEKNEGLALKQLAELAKRDPASAQVVILERLKEFTNVSGGGKAGKRYRIYLSNEGKEFLYVIRKLLEWR